MTGRGDAATRRMGAPAKMGNSRIPNSIRQYREITKGTKTEEFSQKLTKRTKGCRMLSQIQA